MVTNIDKVRKFESIYNLNLTKEAEDDFVEMLSDAGQSCERFQGQCNNTVKYLLEMVGKQSQRK